MNLYLDTEFNGHGGQLVSIALAAESGPHFYAVAPYPDEWHPWVAENVVPHLKQKPEPMDVLRFRLQQYLQSREGCRIYADWPADFSHLLDLFCGPSYDVSFMIDCEMVLLKETAPAPKLPHYAMSDAIALMEWHQAQIAETA